MSGGPVSPRVPKKDGSNLFPTGGGPGLGGGGGGGISIIPCELLIARTYLQSPDPAVVAVLQKGSVLIVKLRKGVGFTSSVALEVALPPPDGRVAGTIHPPELPNFVRCIGESYTYIAVVLEVSGGRVHVEIRPHDHTMP